MNNRKNKNRQKTIAINHSLTKYAIGSDSEQDDLSVSYKGTPYSNLARLVVSIENPGAVAVESLRIVVTLPNETSTIEYKLKKSSNIISVQKSIVEGGSAREDVIKIDRIESTDQIEVIDLVDGGKLDDIKINPRGVDDVKFTYLTAKSIPELRSLIGYIALFLFVGAFPMGGLVQAFVLMISANTIINVINEFRENNKPDKSVKIQHIEIDGESRLQINQ